MNTNGAQNEDVENRCVNSTIAVVREKCKTLILKLNNPSRTWLGFGEAIKPEGDIDQIINELGDNLVRNVIESVNSIRDQVKRARPDESDLDYTLKMQTYKELLDCVTNLINQVTKVFDESLTTYCRRVEELWNNLQSTNDWNVINNYTRQFQHESEELFTKAVQENLNPYLDVIEAKINFVKEKMVTS